MKSEQRKTCDCVNCDRSCYRTESASGTTHRHTSPARAKAKLAALKNLVEGGAA